MKFGLFQNVQWPVGSGEAQKLRDSLEETVFAEYLGYDSVWYAEHHFSRHGIVADGLAVLAYLAGRTSTIRLGTGISVLPLHNPVRVAETAATVDVLSDGRLDFGVGRGYQPLEFNGFNIPLDERPSRFEEGLEVILKSWAATEPFEHSGRHYTYGPISPQPRVVQKPHPPIWLATYNPDDMVRIADNDWGLMLGQSNSLAKIAGHMSNYRAALAKVGKDYDAGKVVLARAMYTAPTDEQAWADAAGPYSEFLSFAVTLRPEYIAASRNGAGTNPFETPDFTDAVMFGSPDTCIAELENLREMGIEHVIFFAHMGGLGHEQIKRSLQLFAEEVRPNLMSSAAA